MQDSLQQGEGDVLSGTSWLEECVLVSELIVHINLVNFVVCKLSLTKLIKINTLQCHCEG